MCSWTAVVRGALQRGLEGPLISHRQARRHYGTRYWAKFREGIDPEANRTWDEFDGVYKCNHLMSWYLKKGEKVAETKAVSLGWVATRGLNSDLSCEDVDIYCCTNDMAPTYKGPGESAQGYLVFFSLKLTTYAIRYVPCMQNTGRPVEYSKVKVPAEEERNPWQSGEASYQIQHRDDGGFGGDLIQAGY